MPAPAPAHLLAVEVSERDGAASRPSSSDATGGNSGAVASGLLPAAMSRLAPSSRRRVRSELPLLPSRAPAKKLTVNDVSAVHASSAASPTAASARVGHGAASSEQVAAV